MKRNLLLFVIASLLSATSFGQHTVSGVLSDKSDKTKLLDNVAVYIPEFNRFDLSKEGGTYILRNVGIGLVNIQFTRVGYKTVVKTISTKDSATVLNVEMEPSAIELEEVAITSNSTKLPENIPYPVTTLSADELRREGQMNLLQALSYEQGIDKISLGNGITKPVIRGLSFNRILLHQFGTRIDNQPWDDRHDMGVNENGVEKVELIKGPAALIYGADAMGGALIFTDEKPAVTGTIGGNANLMFFSNTLGLNGDLGIKGSSNKGLFWSFRGGAQSHTSYVQGAGEEVKKNTEDKSFAANSRYQTVNGKAVVGMSKKWGVTKFTYSLQNQQAGIVELEPDTAVAGGFTAEQRDREMEAPYQDVTSQIASLENTILLKKSKVNFNIAYQDNNRKEFEPLPDKQKETAIGLHLKTTTYDLKYSSDAGKKFGYTIGSQGYIQDNSNFGKEGLVPDAKTSDIGGYVVLRYDLPKWNFLAGGRFDARTLEAESYEPVGEVDSFARPEIELDKEYSLFNGSIGAAFHPLKELTLKANVSTGFTAPNYAQLGTYGKHEGTYRFERGDKNLDPEQNLQTDLGVIWGNPNMEVHLEGFYNKISWYIYIANTGDSTDLTMYNIDSLPIYQYKQNNATLSGAELSLDIHPDQLKWIDLTLSYGMMKGELDKGGNLPYIPADKLIAAVKFTKAKMNYVYNPYLSIVLSNYFEQKNVAEFETPSDGYALLDLHAGGSFRWGGQMFDLTISGTNMFNHGYYNHLSLVRNIGVRDMGRNVSIALRIPFGLKKQK